MRFPDVFCDEQEVVALQKAISDLIESGVSRITVLLKNTDAENKLIVTGNKCASSAERRHLFICNHLCEIPVSRQPGLHHKRKPYSCLK